MTSSRNETHSHDTDGPAAVLVSRLWDHLGETQPRFFRTVAEEATHLGERAHEGSNDDSVQRIERYFVALPTLRAQNGSLASNNHRLDPKSLTAGWTALLTAALPLVPQLPRAQFPEPGATAASLLALYADDVRQNGGAHAAKSPGVGDLPVSQQGAFRERIARALSTADAAARSTALLMLDLSRCSDVHDLLVDTVEDLPLGQIEQRVRACLREEDIIDSGSGDELAVLLLGLSDPRDVAEAANRILNALLSPVSIGDHEFYPSVSIGIALHPVDAADADALIRNARIAKAIARNSGGSGYQFFSADMNRLAAERLRLESELRRAVDREEFTLVYLPKVSCTTGQMTGVEALLRWQHPQRGVVLPLEFIGELERTGLIIPAGVWILHTACRHARAWLDTGAGELTVSVNVSSRQLQDPEFLRAVRQALDGNALEPRLLEIEITESILLPNSAQIISTLSQLRAMGVQIVLDDFGTGYSNLGYLKSLPVDSIKIDSTFVQDITLKPDDASITRAIIVMARSLKLKVIAEGVETAGQLARLVADKCDAIQGYYFSHPVNAAEIETMLLRHKCLASDQLAEPAAARRLLLVDDEEAILSSLRRLLRRENFQVFVANCAEKGLELLAANKIDVVISDQRMPGMTGVDFLRRVKELYPDTIRIVLSGYTDLQSITTAINEGAIYKFLTKPWDDEQLRASIDEAFRRRELAEENRRLSSAVAAAKEELEQANLRLRELLQEKSMQILRDEAALDVTHEVVQQLPWPIVGIDGEGLIALTNASAETLFSEGGPLIGNMANECLPPDVLDWIQKMDTSPLDYKARGIPHRLWCRPMPGREDSRGVLMIGSACE